VQILFFLLNIWIGVEFWLFVEAMEHPTARPPVERPAGVEGWLPIAGLMSFRYLLETGYSPGVHPAALFLFMAFLTTSLLLRKAFCSWLCPVGTVSEWLWKFGRSTFRRNWAPPRWLDIVLRSLKYILLGLFVWAVWGMSALAIEQFLKSPYGMVADVKMLNFFRHMTVTSAVVIGILMIGSIFVKNLWCRYLCPYGALQGLAALLSPLKIRRNKELCIDCGKCAKACPSLLPVDQLVQVRSAECLGCLECIESCPRENALVFALPAPPKRAWYPVRPWQVAAAVCFIFVAFVGYAKATGQWDTVIPEALYRELIANAWHYSHP